MKNKKLTIKDIKKIASLCKLSFNEKELNEFSDQFLKIVEYVEELKEVNIEEIEPTTHITHFSTPLRKDEAGPSLPREEVLVIAPKEDGTFIIVPKVI